MFSRHTETQLMNSARTCSQVGTCTVSTEENEVNHDLKPRTGTLVANPALLYYLGPQW